MRNFLLYHLASGQLVISSSLLVAAGLLIALWGRGQRFKRASDFLMVLGAALFLISGAPWNFSVLLAPVAIRIVGALVYGRPRDSDARRIAWAEVCIWLLIAGSELNRQRLPQLPELLDAKFAVIGDSLSAGVDDAEKTWPALLQEKHQVQVSNFAVAGATVATALEQVSQLDDSHSVVLVEIGGNDLLQSDPQGDLNAAFHKLLQAIHATGRVVVMFELPSLPFRGEMISKQRQMAGGLNVKMIPRRVLAGVVLTDGATTDSLHLSPQGHQQMADEVWRVLAPRVAP